MTDNGYAGKILKMDLSSRRSAVLATSDYAEKYIGGRGLAARLFWDMVPPAAGPLEPDNALICATGPVTGFTGFAGCRWTICANSPAREGGAFSYGNLGGKWGTALKFAGYDGLVVQGKADRPVYLYINDDTIEVRDATALWGQSAFDARDAIKAELGKGVSIISIGQAAENAVAYATALADRGASVSGGLGSVLGSKNLKAIAVSGSRVVNAADPEKLQRLVAQIKEMKGATYAGPSPWAVPGLSSKEKCFGCGIGCSRQSYPAEKGRRYKAFCQAAGVYARPVKEYYGGWNQVQLEAVRLCDGYGLDTGVMQPLIAWLVDCYREGILTEALTGLPLSKAGSREFITALARMIACKEGFGELLAQGTLKAAETLGERAVHLTGRYIVSYTSENKGYDPRMISTAALMYATEPRMPIQQLHGISGNTLIEWTKWAMGVEGSFLTTADLREIAARFWGSPQGADFSTCAGKALAAKTVQDRVYVQECLLLCDLHWPTMMTSAANKSHVGDPGLESKLYSAITGREIDETGLRRIGERIFNLQRAILLRQGWPGRNGDRLLEYFFTEPLQKGEIFFSPDALMPGRGDDILSMVGAVVNREDFEKMKDDYYGLRGWDVASGIPTKAGLEALGLHDVAEQIREHCRIRSAPISR